MLVTVLVTFVIAWLPNIIAELIYFSKVILRGEYIYKASMTQTDNPSIIGNPTGGRY